MDRAILVFLNCGSPGGTVLDLSWAVAVLIKTFCWHILNVTIVRRTTNKNPLPFISFPASSSAPRILITYITVLPILKLFTVYAAALNKHTHSNYTHTIVAEGVLWCGV